MNWNKQYDVIEDKWLVYNHNWDLVFRFECEDMADLMLFCLSKATQ